jgi:hypothetical protein
MWEFRDSVDTVQTALSVGKVAGMLCMGAWWVTRAGLDVILFSRKNIWELETGTIKYS